MKTKLLQSIETVETQNKTVLEDGLFRIEKSIHEDDDFALSFNTGTIYSTRVIISSNFVIPDDLLSEEEREEFIRMSELRAKKEITQQVYGEIKEKMTHLLRHLRRENMYGSPSIELAEEILEMIDD